MFATSRIFTLSNHEPRNYNKHTDEKILLHALKNGEENAFWALWLKYYDRLFYRCLIQMNGNKADAEDVIADCMLKAHKCMKVYAHEIQNTEAWLTRLVNNHCIDVYRQRRNNIFGEDACALDNMSTPTQTPDNSMICSEHFRILFHFASTLKPDLKRVFVMHFLQEKPYEEIALRCGISQANVRKRIQLVRQDLKTSLELFYSGKSHVMKTGSLGALFNTKEPTTNAKKTQLARKELRIVSAEWEGIRMNTHAFVSDNSGDATAKVSTLQSYVLKHPRGWKKHLELAITLEEMGNWEDAIFHYRECREKQPTNPKIAWRLGKLLERMGKTDEASSVLEKAAYNLGDSGYYLLAQSYFLRGAWHRAEALFHKAVSQDPENAFPRHCLVTFLVQNGNLAEACQNLKVIIRKFPDRVKSQALMLDIYRLMGKDSAYKEQLQSFLERFPDNLLGLKHWVDYQLDHGVQSPLLLERLHSLSKISTYSSFYLESTCKYYKMNGNHSKAIGLLDNFVRAHPDQADGWYRLAYYLFEKNPIRAAKALDRANQLNARMARHPGHIQPSNYETLKQALEQSSLTCAYGGLL